MKEMSGSVPFIALRPCGCVFSDASIRSVIPNLSRGTAAASASEEKPDEAKPVVEEEKGKLVTCPNCTKEFDPTLPTSILPINPSKAVQDTLLDNLLIARATAKSSKKRKAAAVEAPTSNGEAKSARVDSSSPVPSRKDSASPAPSTNGKRSTPAPQSNSLHRSVQQKLAEQEQKRLVAQEGMSDAVRAMFKPKEKGKDYHAGNADFFGRTFTRVSFSVRVK